MTKLTEYCLVKISKRCQYCTVYESSFQGPDLVANFWRYHTILIIIIMQHDILYCLFFDVLFAAGSYHVL